MEKQVSVAYISFKPGDNPYQRLFANSLESAGVSVTRIPPSKWFPLVRAKFELKHHDIIHLDWPHDMYAGKSKNTKRLKRFMYHVGLFCLRGAPLVWTVHNLSAHNTKDSEDERAMLQKLVNRCAGLVFLSDSTKRDFFETFQVPATTKTITTHHGHYQDHYSQPIEKHRARAQLGIDPEAVLVLWFGRLQPYKGVEKLVESFEDSWDSNYRLLIAGNPISGDYKQAIQARVRQSKACTNIDLHDRFIPEEQLPMYFSAAEFCAFPFENVANSGSVLAALSFGLPVIAPSLGSLTESITEDLGWLYGPAEAGGLAKALRKAFTSDKGSEHAKRERRILVSERYSWDKVGAAVQCLYSEVAAEYEAS